VESPQTGASMQQRAKLGVLVPNLQVGAPTAETRAPLCPTGIVIFMG